MTNHKGPCQTVFVGDTFPSNKWGTLTVAEYNGTHNVVVQFEDGNKTATSVAALRMGIVKNPYKPSVFGVGYLGDSHRTYPGSSMRKTPEYRAWAGMMKRCYDKSHQEKHVAYQDCKVDEAWHNFTVFADWFKSQIGSELDYHLDKDILKPGNKTYSAETCSLVPRDINNLMLNRKSLRGQYPVGVCKHSQQETFTAQMNKNAKNKYIGSYATPEAAFYAYKAVKESHVRQVAEQYRETISVSVYNALINFTVNITD